jgi:hypothetical protein
MGIGDWIAQGESLPTEAETEVCGKPVRHRVVRDYGSWIATVRRAERAAEATPISVPEEARGDLPDDLETARDIVRSATILSWLLLPPSDASVAQLIRLARVNGPVFAELAVKVLQRASQDGAAAEAQAVEEAKKN